MSSKDRKSDLEFLDQIGGLNDDEFEAAIQVYKNRESKDKNSIEYKRYDKILNELYNSGYSTYNENTNKFKKLKEYFKL